MPIPDRGSGGWIALSGRRHKNTIRLHFFRGGGGYLQEYRGRKEIREVVSQRRGVFAIDPCRPPPYQAARFWTSFGHLLLPYQPFEVVQLGKLLEALQHGPSECRHVVDVAPEIGTPRPLSKTREQRGGLKSE